MESVGGEGGKDVDGRHLREAKFEAKLIGVGGERGNDESKPRIL